MSEVSCVALDWIRDVIEAAEPASTEDLDELRDLSLMIGKEAESTLRLTAIHRNLSRSGGALEEDPAVADLKKRFVEVLKQLERRMQLGDKAVGVEKFYLHRGGLISRKAPKKA